MAGASAISKAIEALNQKDYSVNTIQEYHLKALNS
jgi:hypothetical protein